MICATINGAITLEEARAICVKRVGRVALAQLEKTCRKRGMAVTAARVLRFTEMEQRRREIWKETK